MAAKVVALPASVAGRVKTGPGPTVDKIVADPASAVSRQDYGGDGVCSVQGCGWAGVWGTMFVAEAAS